MRRPDYEPSDVAPRPVIYAGIAFVLGVAVSIGFVTGMLALDAAQKSPTKSEWPTASQQPPAPRLEVDGRVDRAAIENAAAAKLAGYAWADRSAATARIPIERAMELRAAHGWSDAERTDAR